MNKNRWMFALAALVLASLACNALLGNRNTDLPTEPPVPSNNNGGSGDVATPPPASDNGADSKTEFPLPADVQNFTALGSDAINFQTSMKLKGVLSFYRDAFAKEGYKERDITTVISDQMISLVFDGHSSGKAIVLQAVDLGNGTVNVNLRFEDV